MWEAERKGMLREGERDLRIWQPKGKSMLLVAPQAIAANPEL